MDEQRTTPVLPDVAGRPAGKWMIELGLLLLVLGLLPGMVGGPTTPWLAAAGLVVVVGGLIVRAIESRRA